MPASIDEQVIDFCQGLFGRVFSEPFRARIAERLKRNAVIRQVEESADAASQSLTRFLLNEKLTEEQVAAVLAGFTRLGDLLEIDEIANPNVTPESVVARVLAELPCPEAVQEAGHEPVYRVALHSVVQVVKLVAPVMAEWQRLDFSTTFELPRRVVDRLNKISRQIGALGRAGEAAGDERYELSYRDYLLQRFHRVEAGTVRMTTNLDVDLRELFVMPNVRARPLPGQTHNGGTADAAALMDLAAAREFFRGREELREPDRPAEEEADKPVTALQQVWRYPRNVIVGAPGVGKSTFFEWLQFQGASVGQVLELGGQQAIPLLLRVRQLDPEDLPHGVGLIEKATASEDRAALMPPGWIERQMEAGRVVFMLDGVDETEPELRDRCVIPWLHDLCRQYPDCHYLVSSRPVGYPPGVLRDLEFAECDLLDFEQPQIREYTQHWCTAVRLARNEPEGEARREGRKDGSRIVDGFQKHPYICNLARNPLMLSAICLVNYFEGGHLPEDRALLYKLCVEGLLHHWDQRRGIHSEFGFNEKLRACREVALVMQADNRAEGKAHEVQDVFAVVLGDPGGAEKLLEHVRYRTGLLLERRPGVFAFAHLTFQEYLAARGVYEGNGRGVDAERLVQEHGDGRWEEVIPLYCGVAPAPAAREIVEALIEEPDTESLSTVLADAYLSAGAELAEDQKLRQRVLERVAVAPVGHSMEPTLGRFGPEEVAPVANRSLGKIRSAIRLSEAFHLLRRHPTLLDTELLTEGLRAWREMGPFQLTELIYFLHRLGGDEVIEDVAVWPDIYEARGPDFGGADVYGSQAEVAMAGLIDRAVGKAERQPGLGAATLRIFRTLVSADWTEMSPLMLFLLKGSIEHVQKAGGLVEEHADRAELASLARRLAGRGEEIGVERVVGRQERDRVVSALESLAGGLEGGSA